MANSSCQLSLLAVPTAVADPGQGAALQTASQLVLPAGAPGPGQGNPPGLPAGTASRVTHPATSTACPSYGTEADAEQESCR